MVFYLVFLWPELKYDGALKSYPYLSLHILLYLFLSGIYLLYGLTKANIHIIIDVYLNVPYEISKIISHIKRGLSLPLSTWYAVLRSFFLFVKRLGIVLT